MTDALRYAMRALRRELIDFHFDYPLEIDTQAGPKDSLHYYLYSDKLSWSMMSMDGNGIPRVRGRQYGEVYKPAYIAWWGLVHLGRFLRHGGSVCRNIFLKQVDWLEDHAVRGLNGALVWPNPFDCIQGSTVLKAPWPSAYDQGMVISALVRGYRLTKRPRLLELLQCAARLYDLPVEKGGVRIPLPTGALYTELPGGPVPVILDGFETALLGLYDLFVETEDPHVEQLFCEGIEGLTQTLPQWSYRNKWSWYGAHAYLCPPSYHWVNELQLRTLARLSKSPILAQYAQWWDANRLSKSERCEIYLGFLLTKNLSRIKHRTWRHKTERMRRLWPTTNFYGEQVKV